MAANKPVQLTIQDQAIARVTEQRDALAQDYTHLLNESASVIEQYDALRQRFTTQTQRLERARELMQQLDAALTVAAREALLDNAHQSSREVLQEIWWELRAVLGVKDEQ